MLKIKYKIDGISCASCVSNIERSVKKLNGIKSISVNLANSIMTVQYDEKYIINEHIELAVEKAGYKAHLISGSIPQKNNDIIALSKDRNKLFITFFFFVPLFYLSMGHMIGFPLPSFMSGAHNAAIYAAILLTLCIPIIIINFSYFTRGFYALYRLKPNMDSLIAVGAGAAFIYGAYAAIRIFIASASNDENVILDFYHELYFESAGMILALISLGKYLEKKAKAKASNAIKKLYELSPQTALIYVNGIETTVEIADVAVGDVFILKPGMKVPCDGVVISGESFIDESLITGESMPIKKTIGTKVIAGSVNTSGFITAKVEKIGNDTMLAHIIELVNDANASKAPIAKLADKISAIFVPSVIFIALVCFAVWMIAGYDMGFALSIAISVLVISCPCALGLATPTAIIVATGRGANLGIIIKSAEALQQANTIDTVLLDKTGTITQGKPDVVEYINKSEMSDNELMAIISSIENHSEHPLAKSIVQYAQKIGINEKEITNFESISGKGVKGVYNNQTYFIGNTKLLTLENIDVHGFEDIFLDLSNKSYSPVCIANKDKVIALIGISDPIKPTSIDAIAKLKKMGNTVAMITGDNSVTASRIAEKIAIDNYYAEVLPADKDAIVREYQNQGHKVAMVGDGINDSPALARADLGIAVANGTDIAIESADFVLMNSSLDGVPTALKLGKATVKNIKENLFWAFFYNVIAIPIACGVFYPFFQFKLRPEIGALAMTFSSITVVLNALRLRLFGNNKIRNFAYNVEVKGENKYMTLNMTVKNIACSQCAANIKSVLTTMGALNVLIDVNNKSISARIPNTLTTNDISKALSDINFYTDTIEII